uniref:UDP-N-acetylmuramoyl-L-alanine--D-glutamate ligase n=1 Tax=Aquiluna sp. TaxID=2053504 RepID=UPI004048984B
MMLPDSWHGSWPNLKAVVVGLGKSGFSVVDTLVELGVETAVVGKTAKPELVDLVGLIGSKFLASESPEVLSKLGFQPDFAVVSPGFSPSHPLVRELKEKGILVIGDIELAWRLRDKHDKVAEWIGVTGTNGKTTTSEMTQAMLLESGKTAIACGNIGVPILDAIRDPVGFDYLVVELSSFQLHYLGQISLNVAAFLNIAEDHLDWHGDFDSYWGAKAKIYQNAANVIVFNEQDSKTLEAAQQAEVAVGCRAVSFSLGAPAMSSVGYVEEFLVDRAFLSDRANTALEVCEIADIEQISSASSHLLANAAAAATIARACGVEPIYVKKALRSFQLAPHRAQFLGQVGQVRFVNDSKATNAHAAEASLGASESVVWILGGLLKGVNPEPLIIRHGAKLRGVVLLGAETELLEGLFSEHLPALPVVLAAKNDPMGSAVQSAFEISKPGDTVLLAPMAASMDQFLDYAERGDKFVEAARKLGVK